MLKVLCSNNKWFRDMLCLDFWKLLQHKCVLLAKTFIDVARVLTDSPATYGADGCCGSRNSNAGCCGSCCGKSFDEDIFDEQVKKDLEKTRDPDAAPPTEKQPPPSEGMIAKLVQEDSKE